MLRTMRLAHRGPHAGARRQPRPARLPRRGRPARPARRAVGDRPARLHRRGRGRASPASWTARPATAFNDVALVRIPGDGVAAVEVAGRRRAVRALRRGRRDRRHPHRLHRLQLLGRRPDRVAAGRGAARDPGRAALGVQPGPDAAPATSSSMLRVLRPAASLAVEVDGQVAGHVGPGDELEFRVPPAPARWSGSAGPRSTSGPGASCRSPAAPRRSDPVPGGSRRALRLLCMASPRDLTPKGVDPPCPPPPLTPPP